MKSLSTLFLFLPFLLSAQLNPQVIQIPMRDGKSLAADLHVPSQQGEYPVVLIQTPYNKNLFRLGLPLNIRQQIDDSPYAFVVLDWRCFYGSTTACDAGASRGEDGFDAVEWIASQSWCNGKIGTWGPSALGNIQFLTAREQPPHLTCAVPMVAAAQVRYDQYFPGGVVLPEYLATLGILFGDAFQLVGQNPYYNLVWQFAENNSFYPDEIDIPMLHIGGWFDHNSEDMLRWFAAAQETSPAADEQWLLMGPWTHGGTGPSAIGTSMQGELDFPQAMNTHNEVADRFFRYYLLDEQNGWDATEKVMYFQMGSNTWQNASAFPPEESSQFRKYYLGSNGILQDKASGNALSASYVYHPQDPSPTVGGKTLSPELDQGPYDQALLVETREDNVIFTTPVLTTDVATRGSIKVRLYVSSDRPDTDFALRLTEVYPDGRSIALGQIIQRMRFREGYTENDETFMQNGQVYQIDVSFDAMAQTFKAGNRIRLIISSSNYPWFNRNMNTGGEMYPNGNLDTLVNPLVANNTVHFLGQYPSSVELPVVMGTSSSGTIAGDPFVVYPNPASEAIVVSGVNAGQLIQLYDLKGNVILQKTSEANQMTLMTRSLPPGAYVVKSGSVSEVIIIDHR